MRVADEAFGLRVDLHEAILLVDDHPALFDGWCEADFDELVAPERVTRLGSEPPTDRRGDTP